MDEHEITGTVREAEGAVEKGYGRLKDKAKSALRDIHGEEGDYPDWTAVTKSPALILAMTAALGFLAGSMFARRD